MIDVSFIIINYNTDELTLQAVKSVSECLQNGNYEIIVVDNNSKKTRLATSLLTFKNTYFYGLEKNIGFGRANNYGYSKSKGKYIFLLNSDAYLMNNNTIITFMDYLGNNPNVACVGGNLVTREGEANLSYGNFLSVEMLLHNLGIKTVCLDDYADRLAISKKCEFDKPQVVDYVSGAAMMIKREIIEKYGLFDARYFMYFEDMDLCYRYKKAGYLSVLLPDIKIVHIGGQSWAKNEFGTYTSLRIILYSKYLFLKNITNNQTVLILFLLDYAKSTFEYAKSRIRSINRKYNFEK